MHRRGGIAGRGWTRTASRKDGASKTREKSRFGRSLAAVPRPIAEPPQVQGAPTSTARFVCIAAQPRARTPSGGGQCDRGQEFRFESRPSHRPRARLELSRRGCSDGAARCPWPRLDRHRGPLVRWHFLGAVWCRLAKARTERERGRCYLKRWP
ncbi:hypothetical protein M885DRAFT_50927 [Pelagophyceae sp. CCMP2097]|nr:hypothetical protein M885DRAFT_50927 [Pelagophyceae sp. CCMP2097]